MSTMASEAKCRALCSIFCLALVMLQCHVTIAKDTLEIMEEAEVRQLIKDEKYVVILLSDSAECSGRCAELEDTLAAIREDIVESLNAWVIRTYSPKLSEEFGLKATKLDMGIVYVRSGIPLLYTGPAEDDEFMLHTFISNVDSAVKFLSDATFEHDTQASTGATTGDWLVMFTKEGCDTCTHLRSMLEAITANQRGRKNVAIINRDTNGGQTTRRFSVKDFPSFVLFRLGRLYRYELPILNAQTMEAFITDGFRNARAEDIPHPKTPFDDFTEQCADWLRENPSVVNAVLYSVGGLALLVVLAALGSMRSAPATKKESKKKK